MIDFGTIHHLPTENNNVYIKQMSLPAGYYVETHVHNYEHYGLLGSGVAIVEVDGAEGKYIAPCVITIEAGKAHKITALEEITWFCIHSTDETDTNKIDSVLIKGG